MAVTNQTVTPNKSMINIVDAVYPVGSIYMSVNSTSPASLFGGTWEQIKDRFLLGAGSKSAGATGGEENHTLTISEMPSHTHETALFVNPSDTSWGVFGRGNNLKSYKSNYASWFEFYTYGNDANRYAEGDETSLLTKSNGSTSSHNNMPPYLSVYIWKRTS